MRPLLLAFLLAACGGSSKPAPAAPTENVVKEEPPPPPEQEAEEEPPPEEEPYEEPGLRPLDQASLDAGGTGIVECDELIVRTRCSFQKAGSAMPSEAVKAFEDAVQMWKEASVNEATRQATIDACKMSIDFGRDGWEAQGC